MIGDMVEATGDEVIYDVRELRAGSRPVCRFGLGKDFEARRNKD